MCIVSTEFHLTFVSYEMYDALTKATKSELSTASGEFFKENEYIYELIHAYKISWIKWERKLRDKLLWLRMTWREINSFEFSFLLDALFDLF